MTLKGKQLITETESLKSQDPDRKIQPAFTGYINQKFPPDTQSRTRKGKWRGGPSDLTPLAISPFAPELPVLVLFWLINQIQIQIPVYDLTLTLNFNLSIPDDPALETDPEP